MCMTIETNKRPKGYKDQDNLTVKLKSFQRVSTLNYHRYMYTSELLIAFVPYNGPNLPEERQDSFNLFLY